MHGARSYEGLDYGSRHTERHDYLFATPAQLEQLRQSIDSQTLPVHERREEFVERLVEAYQRDGILLLQGETGSGKSIYSPGAVREALRRLGLKDRLIMMQPRKDAATSIATAVAAVEQGHLGHDIGCSTSEVKHLGRDTAIGVVTSGIFLRYLMSGSLTKDNVGAIIIDEIHEGSIEYHLVLGLVKMMKQRGEAPLVLLTSATLDKKRIQDFFDIPETEYLRMEGRTYPVETYHLPKAIADEMKEKNETYIDGAVRAVTMVCEDTDDTEDILVFMPGRAEIQETISKLRHLPDDIEILPLYSGLSPEDRFSVLSGKKSTRTHRRIIVATNIAETSVTVPGIGVVVDSCCKRSKRYNPQTGIIETGTELISKDEAEQRRGRAGRIGPGRAFRVLTTEEYKKLDRHAEPEIRRTNNSHLVLRLKQLNIKISTFPFIAPPDVAQIQAAIQELRMLGALDENENLTDTGQKMIELPFEPRISLLILEAQKRGCVEAALVMAAFEREDGVLLGASKKEIEQEPGYYAEMKKRSANERIKQQRQEFTQSGSDWITALEVFSAAIEHGVFDASYINGLPLHRRTFSQREKLEQFYTWCRTYHFKPEALTHIAFKLREYAENAHAPIDRSTLKQRLDETSTSELGKALIASHPDQLYTSNNGLNSGYFRYKSSTYQSIVKPETVYAHISPRSVAWSAPPAFCIATRVEEGGGKTPGSIKKTYAQRIHPVSPSDIREALPHLVVKESEEMESIRYNAFTDETATSYNYYIQNPNGSRTRIERVTEVVTDKRAVRAFAEAMMDGHVELPFVRANTRLIETIHQSREGFDYSVYTTYKEKLLQWYIQQLGTAHTMSEIENNHQKFYCSKDILDPPPPKAPTPQLSPQGLPTKK